MKKLLLVLSAVMSASVACGSSSPRSSPTSPSSQLSISVSPPGFGLHDATVFLFTASGGRDIVNYRWDFGDGDTKSGSETAATHIYRLPGLSQNKRSASFNVQLQATDSRGNVTTAALTGITIGSIAGTWDLTLVPLPSYPWFVCTRLTARLYQSGAQISGSITPTVCTVQINPCHLGEPLIGYSAPTQGDVSDPRRVHFGNESFSAVYNSDCVDTYFRVELSNDLNTMNGTCEGGICSSVTAVRKE